MSDPRPVLFSVLDLAPVPNGSTSAAALRNSLDLARRVEQLGYHRAWLNDSPALYWDPWMTLALAAERTERIGLGVSVVVPSLRHVLVTASALLDPYIKFNYAMALDGSGKSDKAKPIFRELAIYNFNSLGYALIRKEAQQMAM